MKTNFKIYYTNKLERIKIVFKVVSFIREMDIDVYSLTQTMTETENGETLAADNTVNKVQVLLCRDIVTKDEQEEEEEEAESFSVAIYTSNQSPTCGTSLRFL